jgi:hypothetical protein
MFPLDPHHLTPPISLNRVRMIDLPGLAVDAGVKGKNAYDLVSTRALAEMIREHADTLTLDPTADDPGLSRAFDACLDSETPEISAAAEAVARRIGRQLGYVLLALRRGDPVNRAARDEWDDSYWSHWAAIRQVWLGGGLVSGRLGPRLCAYARGIFVEAGYDDYMLRLSPYGAALPLVGMARRAPADSRMATIFDFGQTATKRALAIYDRGELLTLERFSDHPTTWRDPSHEPGDADDEAARLLDRLIDVIAETHAQARIRFGEPPPSPVLASLSAYVRDGQPLLAQCGSCAAIARITDNMQRTIADRLGTMGHSISGVTLEHDGTAAAVAHAGEPRAAVITIGTALGIGFPPGDAGLRPLRRDFVLV